MRERPILFSGPMVQAILEGRKTQTRRVVKPHHLRGSEEPGQVLNILGRGMLKEAGLLCPYGQPGDRLWVRETWRLDAYNIAAEYRSTTSALMEYVAPWRPSIHMPRWASRITLEIEAVRVERLQDISEEDAVAEGCDEAHLEHTEECKSEHCALAGGVDDCCGYLVSAKLEYKALWQSINGHGSWDANPFVWVMQFRRLKP